MLMPVWVPEVARDFTSRVNFQCRLIQCPYNPQRAIACISICVCVTNPKHWQPYHCLDTEILQTLIGMVSAALVAAVPSPGKVTEFPAQGNSKVLIVITVHMTCPLSGLCLSFCSLLCAHSHCHCDSGVILRSLHISMSPGQTGSGTSSVMNFPTLWCQIQQTCAPCFTLWKRAEIASN